MATLRSASSVARRDGRELAVDRAPEVRTDKGGDVAVERNGAFAQAGQRRVDRRQQVTHVGDIEIGDHRRAARDQRVELVERALHAEADARLLDVLLDLLHDAADLQLVGVQGHLLVHPDLHQPAAQHFDELVEQRLVLEHVGEHGRHAGDVDPDLAIADRRLRVHPDDEARNVAVLDGGARPGAGSRAHQPAHHVAGLVVVEAALHPVVEVAAVHQLHGFGPAPRHGVSQRRLVHMVGVAEADRPRRALRQVWHGRREMLAGGPGIEVAQSPAIGGLVIEQAAQDFRHRGGELLPPGKRRERAGADLGGDDLLLRHAFGRIAPDMELQDENAERVEIVGVEARAAAVRIGDGVLDGLVEHGLREAGRHAEALAEHHRALAAGLIEQVAGTDSAMWDAELRQLAKDADERPDHLACQLRLGHGTRRRDLAAEHALAFWRVEDQRRTATPYHRAVRGHRPVDHAAGARPHHRRVGRRFLGKAEEAARQVPRRHQREHGAAGLVAVVHRESFDAGRIELGHAPVRRNLIPFVEQDLIVRHRPIALCAQSPFGRAL